MPIPITGSPPGGWNQGDVIRSRQSREARQETMVHLFGSDANQLQIGPPLPTKKSGEAECLAAQNFDIDL